jgi:signal peptidase I
MGPVALKTRGGARTVVRAIFVTALVAVAILIFAIEPYRVEQGDMTSTLASGEYLLIDKLTPHWAPYHRGDIVVFRPPSAWLADPPWPFVKRVIGLPGDHIELRDGLVYVDGAGLDEPYIYRDGGLPVPTEAMPDGPTSWDVPEGSLFVLGDERTASADSRSFGPIAISAVVGRAWLRVWPLDTFEMLPAAPYPTNPAAAASRSRDIRAR